MSKQELPFLTFMTGALALDNAPALCDDKADKWLTYGELRQGVRDLTAFWQAKSSPFGRGLILLEAPRTVQGAMGYIGSAAGGHALLIVDTSSVRLDAYMEAYEPEWVLLASPLKPQGPYSLIDYPLEGFFLWQRATPASNGVHDDLFILLLPPSSPDLIKTVRIAYDAIAHNTQATQKAIDLSGDACFLGHMPLSYSFGLSVVHLALAVGARCLLSEYDIKNRQLWETVQKRQVTHFAGIPFHFEHLARVGLDNLHVPRLKTFLQAGGRMPTERVADLLRQITEREGAFYVMYGLTEASPRIASCPLHKKPEKVGSSGTVLEGSSLRVTPGGLVYEGPNVMMGYAEKRADLALGDTQKGCLIIREPARIDDEGFLFFDA